jgi:hypothetical protein
MIEGLLEGIAEAYIKEQQMRINGETEDNINFSIREIINKHSGLRVGSKIHYVPTNQERCINTYGNTYIPKKHIGVITKMTIISLLLDLSISEKPANVTSKINVGVLQLGIFVPEDNMGYVINLDEFNIYDDDINFCTQTYND